MKLTILSISIVLVIGFVWWGDRAVQHGPGITAPDAPTQEAAADEAAFEHKDFRLNPRARFEIEARVLGKERYWFGRSARLSPYDLALGWGRMSDEAVLEEISVWQSGRFYWWTSRTMPIPRHAITHQSANVHIIPSDDDVESDIGSLRSGQVVRLTGHLVDVSASDGWRWGTSMSREDSGNGSCEILWVEAVSVVRP